MSERRRLGYGHGRMVKTFQITVTFYLGEGEEDAMEGGVNGFGGEHGNKRAKPMKVEGSEDVPRELDQVHVKRNVQILKESFKGVKVLLGLSDPKEEANEFMRNRVFTKEGDLFDGMEDNGGFKDGSIERVNSMYGQERRVN